MRKFRFKMLQIPYVGSVKSVADTLIMDGFEMLSFESKDNSLISKMDRVIKYEGRYYVLDKRMKHWKKSTFPSSLKEKTYECEELNKLTWEHDYVWSISDLQDSEENILFRTNIPGLFVLSKRMHSVESYDLIFNASLGIPLPNYIPVDGDGNEVFFVCPVYVLKEQIGDRQLPNEMITLLESMDEDSNPLILKYNLK